MLTVVGIPKPFDQRFGVIQTNAVRSWMRLGADRVVLLGNEFGTAALAAEVGAVHVPSIAVSDQGTPLVNAIIRAGETAAAGDWLCYVNADIILLDDLLPSVRRAIEPVGRCLIIGRRWDVDWSTPIDFSPPAIDAHLRREARRTGRLHDHHAMDYFIFPRGLWPQIPPFAVGRTLWDNWLVWQALCSGVPVIDASDVITAIHQHHDYSHVAGSFSAAWFGTEARRNLALLGGVEHIYDLRDATWMLTANGVRPARTLRHRLRRLAHAPSMQPMIRPLQHLKRVLQHCAGSWSMRSTADSKRRSVSA